MQHQSFHPPAPLAILSMSLLLRCVDSWGSCLILYAVLIQSEDDVRWVKEACSCCIHLKEMDRGRAGCYWTIDNMSIWTPEFILCYSSCTILSLAISIIITVISVSPFLTLIISDRKSQQNLLWCFPQQMRQRKMETLLLCVCVAYAVFSWGWCKFERREGEREYNNSQEQDEWTERMEGKTSWSSHSGFGDEDSKILWESISSDTWSSFSTRDDDAPLSWGIHQIQAGAATSPPVNFTSSLLLISCLFSPCSIFSLFSSCPSSSFMLMKDVKNRNGNDDDYDNDADMKWTKIEPLVTLHEGYWIFWPNNLFQSLVMMIIFIWTFDVRILKSLLSIFSPLLI